MELAGDDQLPLLENKDLKLKKFPFLNNQKEFLGGKNTKIKINQDVRSSKKWVIRKWSIHSAEMEKTERL